MKSIEDRFWSKVRKTDTCWLWTGSKTTAGYGNLRLPTGYAYAHRLSYEMHVGLIPDGMVLDHLCRLPNCVNPQHLEPVTQAENVRRGNAGVNMTSRTHCPKNHEYTPENTRRYWTVKSDWSGWERKCLTCKRHQGRESARRRRERLKQHG